jgi:hypothetical protein
MGMGIAVKNRRLTGARGIEPDLGVGEALGVEP